MIEPLALENLKIHCCRFQKDIHPWIQHRLLTPYWRFYWNPVPGGFLTVGDEEIELLPEYFYVIPGYLIFSTFARAPFAQFYIHFNLNSRLRRGDRIFRLSADPVVAAHLKSFAERDNCPQNEQLQYLTGIYALTATLVRLPEAFLRLPAAPDPRIEAVLRRMEKHPEHTCRNAELAASTGMSRNGFLRLFLQEIGESPQQFLRRKRVERACELLHFSNDTIDEIAEKTGFSDRYYFSRTFSKLIGSSPASFRRQRVFKNS